MRADLTRMLIEGQVRGSAPAQVIGEDYRAFCDQVIAELPPSSPWERALRAVGNCCLYIGVLGLIWFFTSLAGAAASGHAQWAALPVRLGTVVSSALIIAGAALFVQAVCHTALDGKAESKKKDRFLMAILLLTFAVSAICSLFLQTVVFSLPTLPALLLIAALLLCSKWIGDQVD